MYFAKGKPRAQQSKTIRRKSNNDCNLCIQCKVRKLSEINNTAKRNGLNQVDFKNPYAVIRHNEIPVFQTEYLENIKDNRIFERFYVADKFKDEERFLFEIWDFKKRNIKK